jgi:tryptophanyl-tRNA synthetase
MVIDWLAAGLDPNQCTLFLQSRIPEHAELFTLLAMGTPTATLMEAGPAMVVTTGSLIR